MLIKRKPKKLHIIWYVDKEKTKKKALVHLQVAFRGNTEKPRIAKLHNKTVFHLFFPAGKRLSE